MTTAIEQTVLPLPDISELLAVSPDSPEVLLVAESLADQLVKQFGRDRGALIPILQEIQTRFRYLPEPVLKAIAAKTDILPSDIIGVATFYTRFRLTPIGRHRISVCTGTACHVKGASLVLDAFRKELGLPPGEDTDAKKLFTIEKIACLGCCTLAPVVQIDTKTYGHVSPASVPEIIADFLAQSEKNEKPADKHFVPEETLGEIRIGLGSCCQAQGSQQVFDEVQNVLMESGVAARIKPVGCIGMCHQTPLLEIVSPKGESTYFAKVRPEEVRSIVLNKFRPKSRLFHWKHRFLSFMEGLWSDELVNPVRDRRLRTGDQRYCDFMNKQVRIATALRGLVCPLDFKEYVSNGGFQAFRSVLFEKTPDDVLAEMKTAGIRGRGGAGFPTWRKWTAVREAEWEQKFIVCNGDEGDPGAFMDRMLLESYPFRILEGMLIAARTVGAEHGYLYIRAEYPLAVMQIRKAIAILEREGYLGKNILGSDFSFTLAVMEGAGAFVCGEETALLESMEGRRGMPRLRPPFPAQSGLFGKPTLINNVETWALVPWVFTHGGQAFAAYGTEKSPGTKVFALAGKIRRGGLIEVPMGITLRTIVDEIGGGIANDKQFKAVQIGGPSGGCVPAELDETPVNFESLAEVGAIMGSGGLVVLDEDDCMVDFARYFLQFTQEQSCGKCTFCRIGTRRMLEMLDRLCTGQGKPGDIEKLEDLAKSIQKGSLCGLGKTAPNPVLSTLRFFRREYEDHLNGICTTGKCQSMIEYRIDKTCNGCTRCAEICPTQAIRATPYRRHEIDQTLCTRCDSCRKECPNNAVRVWSGPNRDVRVK